MRSCTTLLVRRPRKGIRRRRVMGRRGEEEDGSQQQSTNYMFSLLFEFNFIFFLARSLNVVLSKFVVLPYLTYYLITSCDTVRF
jgi:hypothetical protein